MATTHKRKYGIDWPADYPDEMIELVCAKKWRDLGTTIDHPAEHLLRACRSLFVPEQFKIHRWTEEHAKDFTETDFCITWGAGATSKSNDYGLFMLLDWMVDPNDTIALIGSTTKDALKKRSWESVLRYLNILKKHPRIDFPGRSKSSGYSILNTVEDDDAAQAEKAGIFGVALDESGKLQGAHLPFVRILVDEIATLQSDGAREAIETAISNLRKGAVSFKFFGLANPESWFDLSGYYAEPKAGRSTVTVDSEVWETRFGRVRHHDGLKSPAITEENGAKEYPFLVNMASIEADRRELGDDNPVFWRMVRGFPTRQGEVATVMTETDIVAGKATEKDVDGVRLDHVGANSTFFRTLTIGSLDSAFSQGGDSAILQAVKIIYLNGLPTLFFIEPTKIPILESSDRPVTYQIVDFTRGWLTKHDVQIDHLAADDSGTQSVCDVLTIEIAPGVFRVNYSNSASDMPISNATDVEAKKKFKDRATEAWAVLAEFVKSGQVRGLSDECARQLAARRYMTTKSGVVVEPRRLEKKADFKARTKLGSPDEADAAAMAALLARHRLGILPGSGVYPQQLARAPTDIKPAFTLRSASSFKPGVPTGDPLARMLGRYK